MTSILAPMCYFCTHQNPDDQLSCDAFPLGIPRTILTNQTDHRVGTPGDSGIIFEPRDRAAEKSVEEHWNLYRHLAGEETAS